MACLSQAVHTINQVRKNQTSQLLGGMGVYIIGALAGLLIMPDDDDIYQFVNTFNRNSQNRKMNWEIGLNLGRLHKPELKLTLSY